MVHELTSSELQSQDVVLAIAASGDLEENEVMFAACQSGLYRSRDSGSTWKAALPSGADGTPPSTAVALSPQYGSDRTVLTAIPGGILISSDGGEAWHASVLPTPPPVVSSLITSPRFSLDGIAVAGTLEDGVFRSNDQGRTWASANIGLLDQRVLALQSSPDFAQDGVIFAGTSTGVFISRNWARSWSETATFAEASMVTCLALSPTFAKSGTLFAGTENSGLWWSEDHGEAWRSLGDSLATSTVHDLIVDMGDQRSHSLLALTDSDLVISRDNGHTWDAWNRSFAPAPGTVAVLAPFGLSGAGPVLVGLPGCQIQAVEATSWIQCPRGD